MSTVFFDMDGVFADIIDAFRKLLELPPDWTPDDYDFYKKLGHDWQWLFEILDKQPIEFWLDIPHIPEGINLLKKACDMGHDVYILSTSPFAHSSDGKMLFVRKYLPEMTKKVLLVSSRKGKALLSGPGRILIDDDPSHIPGWEKRGGTFLLLVTSYTPPDLQSHALTFQDMEDFLRENILEKSE